MKLIYNVKDKPKFGQLIVFAIQQILAIMAATIAVPAIIGNGMSQAAALFGAGIGTLVYQLFTKFKSPVFLGSSFAFLGSMAAAFAGGVSAGLGHIGLILGATFAGLVYVIIAAIVKFVGAEWLNKLMPAVVIGPTVAIIGLSLAGNAVADLQSVNYTETLDTAKYSVVEYVSVEADDMTSVVTGSEVYKVYDSEGNECSGINVAVNEDGSYTLTAKTGSVYAAIVCGLITLAVICICSVYGKRMAKLIPFILGILAGYAVATVFTLIGIYAGIDSLKIVNFAPLLDLFENGISLSTFISVPDFTFITALGAFGEINGEYIATIAVAYTPVALVVFAEHVADHKNISSIIESDLLEDPGLHRTLLGDGVGSIVGSIFGGCPNTTYGESVGCVAITGNASVITIFTAAIGCILISFFSPFVAFLSTIPSCVMGGVCMSLYGFIAVSGLKMIQKVDLEKNSNLFVVSVILIAGIGGFAVSFGSVQITSIACALILGILINILVNRSKK